MAMGKRIRDRQPTMWLAITDLPTAASHAFYRRLKPDHSTISRTRRLIDLEMHRAVFTWVLQCLRRRAPEVFEYVVFSVLPWLCGHARLGFRVLRILRGSVPLWPIPSRCLCGSVAPTALTLVDKHD